MSNQKTFRDALKAASMAAVAEEIYNCMYGPLWDWEYVWPDKKKLYKIADRMVA